MESEERIGAIKVKCSYCGKEFYSYKQLARHILRSDRFTHPNTRWARYYLSHNVDADAERHGLREW